MPELSDVEIGYSKACYDINRFLVEQGERGRTVFTNDSLYNLLRVLLKQQQDEVDS